MSDEPILLQPLSDSELDYLGDFLQESSMPGMNVEMFDGFLTALVCGPDLVSPSEYLPFIWEDRSFDDSEENDELLELVMRHWNTIFAELSNTLEEENDFYHPILMAGEDGIAHGNDWAYGFMHGVQLCHKSWDKLVKDKDAMFLIAPIMMLAFEHNPDPNMRLPEMTPEEREGMLHMMITGLTFIYDYFEPERRLAIEASTAPLYKEQGPKLRRNASCPCGSGRKYKHCCAADV